MKTKEELNALKSEVETLNTKLAELTEDELTQVTGGVDFDDGFNLFEITQKLLEVEKALREQAENLKTKP